MAIMVISLPFAFLLMLWQTVGEICASTATCGNHPNGTLVCKAGVCEILFSEVCVCVCGCVGVCAFYLSATRGLACSVLSCCFENANGDSPTLRLPRSTSLMQRHGVRRGFRVSPRLRSAAGYGSSPFPLGCWHLLCWCGLREDQKRRGAC